VALQDALCVWVDLAKGNRFKPSPLKAKRKAADARKQV